MQNKSATNILFIDVSHWEEGIDWQAVKASGIQAAYAKARGLIIWIRPL